MKPRLTIIAIGMGSIDLLTGRAADALRQSDRVLATSRIGSGLGALSTTIETYTLSGLISALEEGSSAAAVLVSGDAGFYSLSKSLVERLSSRYNIEIINGISSLQYLAGRMGISYDDILPISLHGRFGFPEAFVSYNKKVFFLTGGENSAEKIIAHLVDAGMEELMITVGQRLSYPDEKISSGRPSQLLGRVWDPLCAIIVENPQPGDRYCRLRDEDFIRGDIPMTKESIRTLAIDRLEVAPDDIVYDIGAGTGSVSVALARKAYSSMVYALEKKQEGIALIKANRQKFRCYNIAAVEGTAPEALRELPPPDKVFIGGSGGQLEEIITLLISKGNSFTLCINTITLESLNSAVTLMDTYGFTHREIEQISHARAKQVGGYNMMMGENPVYIISGRKEIER